MTAQPDDERRAGNHMTAVLAMLCAVLFVFAVPFLFIRFAEGRAGASAAATAAPRTEEMLAGERVYQRNCAGCHEWRGEGRPGRYPPLAGASWLLDDKETPIRITLLGVAGSMDVDGRSYDNVMPNFGVTLTDAEIANVLTFVRGSWGNGGSAITPEEVAKVRASLAGRNEAWKGGAALLEAKKTRVLR
jgi:mono/diheme cytochrome c family protein